MQMNQKDMYDDFKLKKPFRLHSLNNKTNSFVVRVKGVYERSISLKGVGGHRQ